MLSNLTWASGLIALCFPCFTVKDLEDFRMAIVERERKLPQAAPTGRPTLLANAAMEVSPVIADNIIRPVSTIPMILYKVFDLRGGYNNINFSLLDVYLDEKGPSVKIQLSNIFKDHRIVAKPSNMSVGYNEWPLFSALWMKYHDRNGKYKPELNEYFHMY